jgi:hypothetical protein
MIQNTAVMACNPQHNVLSASCRDLGSNALILPAGKPGSSAREPKQQQEQQLSKSQLKKLRQVQLKKERRQQLSEVRGAGTCRQSLDLLCTHAAK